jgi:hypothetical protein
MCSKELRTKVGYSSRCPYVHKQCFVSSENLARGALVVSLWCEIHKKRTE